MDVGVTVDSSARNVAIRATLPRLRGPLESVKRFMEKSRSQRPNSISFLSRRSYLTEMCLRSSSLTKMVAHSRPVVIGAKGRRRSRSANLLPESESSPTEHTAWMKESRSSGEAMSERHSVFSLLSEQRRFIYLAVGLLSAAGIWAALRLPSAIYPELVFPRITVVVQGSALGARQVVFAITRPIEEAVSIVPGVTARDPDPFAHLSGRSTSTCSRPMRTWRWLFSRRRRG